MTEREKFEAWFEQQYGKKPMPSPKHGDEPHNSVYMTMYADGAHRGWQACAEQKDAVIENLEKLLKDRCQDLDFEFNRAEQNECEINKLKEE